MKKLILFYTVVLSMLYGCSSSKITSTWKDNTSPTKNFRKILVLGLIRDNDRQIQERMENHLVNDLKDLGYNSISSLQEYGPKAFDGLNEEQSLLKLKNSGVDAVITIVLLDKEKERHYVPGRMNYSPYGYYYNRWWGYMGTLYHRIYEPGYYITDTKYFWESNLYEMENQKLVYSAQTQSFDPSSSESLGHQYGVLIIKRMVRDNVLFNLKKD